MSARDTRSAVRTTHLGAVSEPFRAALREHLQEHPEAVCIVDASPVAELAALRRTLPGRFVAHDPRDGDAISFVRRLSRSGFRPLLCVAGRPSLAESFADACEERPAGDGPRVVDLAPGPAGFPRCSGAALRLARTAPGATVIDCGDAIETRTVLGAATGIGGPLYIRAFSGLVPILFEAPLEPGRARLLSRGRDVCLVSSSSATWAASEAALRLRALGVTVTHLHVSTLRPLDDPVVPRALEGTRVALTLEPAGSAGLLGSAIAEVIARYGLGRRQVSLAEGAAVEQAAVRLLDRSARDRRPQPLVLSGACV